MDNLNKKIKNDIDILFEKEFKLYEKIIKKFIKFKILQVIIKIVMSEFNLMIMVGFEKDDIQRNFDYIIFDIVNNVN